MTRTSRTFALATLASVAIPATASADRVTSLQPWKATNTYYARADLDGRAAPKLKPVAKVNHVRAGQWVRITCQVRGENAYGSTLWSKVNGLYVPDTFLKTYTDGFIRGVPRCDAAPPPPPPPSGPTRAELAAAVSAVAFERVYGSNFRIYKAKYPNHGIIWDNNGCSVPEKILELNPPKMPLGKAVGYYADLFEKSCDRHDFGYRNYGAKTNGLKLDSSPSRRLQIDDRFHSNMDYQCKVIFSRKYVEAIQRGACYKASDIFYKAVRSFAGGHFY